MLLNCVNMNHMPKKESGIIAVLALVVIVAVIGIAGLMFYYQNSIKQAVVPVNKVAVPLGLTLESPVDGSLIKDNKVLVKGRTAPNTTVVFYTDSDDNSIQSDENGNFESYISLGEGINTLTVTAFGENGDEKSVTLDVVNDNS